MSKLRTLLVDDEPLARDLLRSIATEIADIDIIGECKNGREAIDSAMSMAPDLIFLDIMMPQVNGFEVVKALQSDAMPMVIFATAYNQYAVDAFDMHAVDYLLKPFDPERISVAVQRAVERKRVQQEVLKAPLIGAINDIAIRLDKDQSGSVDSGDGQENLAEEQPERLKRKLLIRDSGTVKLIPFEDIDWIDAAGDYMCIHALGETHIMRSTLLDLQKKLDDNLFVRIHRSTVVNITRVVSTSLSQKRGSLVHLSDGQTLKVSRNHRESTRKLFQ
ncbi:MAG: LytTR family DNA-binding domain-containing protein [Porticoccaceae bacterium]|nr:LytTR family DNA-binding domain-containing protein [Porticoccaceae bacterium]